MKTNHGQLSHTIDQVNAAFFWCEKLTKAKRIKLAKSIVAAHRKPGAYANTFALSDEERKKGISLFTGERTFSASARHISGEEACRALRLLEVNDRRVKSALREATEGLQECLVRCQSVTGSRMGGNPGIFCCGRCTVSLWRHIVAGGFDRREERLRAGVGRLKDFRDGKGRWAVFPFWYTLSALVEIDLPEALEEIRYAAPILERAVKRESPSDEFERRRCEISRRGLAKLISKTRGESRG
jgi:hypothetical protein